MVMDKFKSASVRNSYKSQLTSVTSSWLSQINALSGDAAREEKIYTLLCDKIVYTHDSPFDQSLAAALIDGKCVCNGYAQSMVYLCNLANIDCIMLVSDAHAWNMVKLDNVWYYIDVTWMDQDWGIWEDWINVDSAAKVTAQDQDNNHVLLTSLYSGISLPQAGGNSGSGGSSDGNSGGNSGGSSGGNSGGSSGGNSGGSSGGNSGGSSGGSSVGTVGDIMTMTAEGVLAKPALKITMPKSMSFVFNPYGLTVNEKGAIDNDAGISGTLVGSYAFDPTDNSGWHITNSTGTPVKAAVYAYALNKNPAEFEVIDRTGSSDAKRSLKVALAAKADSGDAAVVSLKGEKLDTKAKSIWSLTNGSTVIEQVENKLYIYFDTDNCSAVKEASDSWSEKDIVKIDFIFAFELTDI